MRFDGEHEVGAPVAQVWRALHDGQVLRAVVPGCVEMRRLTTGVHAATLQARVGPVADTYRGTFTIDDLVPGSELRVRVSARGRCGRLDVTLGVVLLGRPGTTVLRYGADATVGGLAGRLGSGALAVVGQHFTCGFFQSLDRAVRRGAGLVPGTGVPQPA